VVVELVAATGVIVTVAVVHAPEAKSNPVSQVAATLFVADVQVTVEA
jgi:hypothetical protein